MNDLKKIYRAISKEIAENYVLELEEKWGKKYPLVVKSWQNNWENLSSYFKYSGPVRKLIYTPILLRDYIDRSENSLKPKGSFTSTNALYKQVYCAIKKIGQKWTIALPNHTIQSYSLLKFLNFTNRQSDKFGDSVDVHFVSKHFLGHFRIEKFRKSDNTKIKYLVREKN